MTAEPRDVPAEHPACEHHWTSIHQPDFPVAVYWIDTCSLCGDINGARLAEEVEPLLARLAAADRENAELRGEIERLTAHLAGEEAARYEWSVEDRAENEVLAGERDDLRSQLAAAQAQLAEFDRECYERSLEQQDALARLEAVRALAARMRRSPVGVDYGNAIMDTIASAALSAAPQPEPERDARVGDTVTATLRGTLIAYDTDLGKWTLETDGTDHIAWQIELHWAQPFEVVQREPESPASDEPARCSTCGGSFDSPGCCKSPDDDRPRAEAGFHTIDGGPVTSDGPR